jgi:nucleotide-binding universal stress UspA family protein
VTQFPIKTIIHPTDFSDSSLDAFAHAMAFSLAAKCHLYIVHVAKDGEDRTCYSFPHLRDLLTLWRRIGPHERPEAIEALTGVKISKVAIGPGDARRCIDDFILGHGCDLMVLSTHHRNAVRRVVSPSVATGAADDSRIPTLFLRDDVKRFIDRVSGACHLETVLIPVGSEINEEVLQKRSRRSVGRN